MINCLHCEKKFSFKKNTNNKYCSNKCQLEYQGKQKVENWLKGNIEPTKSIVTRYLKEHKGYFCHECKIEKWNKKSIVFEIDHIDGNSLNNHYSNFRFLCPNCHSQTSSYKGRNRGKGRPKETKSNTIQSPFS